MKNCGVRFFPRRAVVYIFDNANNRPRSRHRQEPNLDAERASHTKVAVRYCARDEQHWLVARAVRFVKPPSFQQPHAHSAQVILTDGSRLRGRWIAEHLLQRPARWLKHAISKRPTSEWGEAGESRRLQHGATHSGARRVRGPAPPCATPGTPAGAPVETKAHWSGRSP